jgi:hypothetical protein
VPAALGVEMTSGYDGSVLNGLQAVKPWLDCRFLPPLPPLPFLCRDILLNYKEC